MDAEHKPSDYQDICLAGFPRWFSNRGNPKTVFWVPAHYQNGKSFRLNPEDHRPYLESLSNLWFFSEYLTKKNIDDLFENQYWKFDTEEISGFRFYCMVSALRFMHQANLGDAYHAGTGDYQDPANRQWADFIDADPVKTITEIYYRYDTDHCWLPWNYEWGYSAIARRSAEFAKMYKGKDFKKLLSEPTTTVMEDTIQIRHPYFEGHEITPSQVFKPKNST